MVLYEVVQVRWSEKVGRFGWLAGCLSSSGLGGAHGTTTRSGGEKGRPQIQMLGG